MHFSTEPLLSTYEWLGCIALFLFKIIYSPHAHEFKLI